jgi:hypothetical protein
VFVSVRLAIFAGMMDNEADNFRRIQLVTEVERAKDMVARYREGIDFYRDQISRYCKRLGRIAERLGEPEEGDHDDR